MFEQIKSRLHHLHHRCQGKHPLSPLALDSLLSLTSHTPSLHVSYLRVWATVEPVPLYSDWGMKLCRRGGLGFLIEPLYSGHHWGMKL